MKKSIVALLCAAPIACFAMEEKNAQPRFRDIPRFLGSIAKSQERQADAAELQAVSTAVDYCANKFGRGYSVCITLEKQYFELITKNQNNS